MPAWVWALALAPIVGSFLTAAADRLPDYPRELLLGRSRCPACGALLGIRDLVPLVSYALAGGRCRRCGAPIPRDHLLLEVGAVAVALGAALVDRSGGVLATCLLGWALLLLAVIDWRTGLLPDMLTLPLLAAGLLEAALREEPLGPRLAGAAAGYGALVALAYAYRRWRQRDGLGRGDAKLLAAGGAWAGIAALPTIVLVAALAGLAAAVLAARGRPSATTSIAFGPWLALAIWLIYLSQRTT